MKKDHVSREKVTGVAYPISIADEYLPSDRGHPDTWLADEDLLQIGDDSPEQSSSDCRLVLNFLGQNAVLSTLHDSRGLFFDTLEMHRKILREASEDSRHLFDIAVQQYIMTVREMVAVRILPDEAVTDLEDQFKVEFAFGDRFALGDGALGQYDPGIGGEKGALHLSYENFRQRGEFDAETTLHELLHVQSHMDIRTKFEALLLETLQDPRGANDLAVCLEEAATEHLAQVILGVRGLDNLETTEDDETYNKERQLLKLIVDNFPAGYTMYNLAELYFGKLIDANTVNAFSYAFRNISTEAINEIITYLPNYDEQERIFDIGLAARTN